MDPFNTKVDGYEQPENFCSLHQFPTDEETAPAHAVFRAEVKCNQWVRAIGDEGFVFGNDKVLRSTKNECCCDFADDDYHAYVKNFCATSPTLTQSSNEDNMKIWLSDDSFFTKANSELKSTSPLKEEFIENLIFQEQQFHTTELFLNTEHYKKELSLDNINENYNLNEWNAAGDSPIAFRSAFIRASPPVGKIKEYFDMDSRTVECCPSDLSPIKKLRTETYTKTERCTPYTDQTGLDKKFDASFQQMNEEVIIDHQSNQLGTVYFKSAGILEQLRKLEQFCYAMKPLVVQAILSEINSLLSRYDQLDNYEQQF